ncbi:MAG: hypothetical protein N2422_06640 [Rhodobacteraceae bacterium]|nr:hypothetical protein [Paracoccaceae bacterium]
MKRQLIAAVAAGSLALSGLAATPAAAWGEREQNALALILGLGIAGMIIDNANRDRRSHHSGSASRRIPGECVYDIRTGQGLRSVVSKSCVEDYALARLPSECAFTVRSHGGGNRVVYGTRCLKDNGFRIEDVRY